MKGADRYLLDQVRARMNFPTTVMAIKRLTEKWPDTSRKFVEEKANGSALLDTLQHEIFGFVPVNPTGDKFSRVHAISAQVESGNVYLPHPHVATWVESFIIECVSFPAHRNDDQVDALSQALNATIKPKRRILCA